MGKSTRKRQAIAEKKERILANRLIDDQSVSGKQRRGKITAHTEGIMTDILHHLEQYSIRPIDNWAYTGKSNRIDKQRRSLLRYMCGIYPVPSFLEDPMIINDNDRFTTPVLTALSTQPEGNIIPWYVAIAQGKSLYKTCTRDFLTKRETHLLLQAPNDLNIKAAIWWVRAMAISDDIGIAYRVARSNFINRAHVQNPFWIDVHRFFVVNDVPLKEFDELLDYIGAVHTESGKWTIKKRSLESIRRKSEEWHRAQYKMKHIGGGSWTGMEDIPTWNYKTGKPNANPHKSTETEWKIEQILTGNRLAKEGQRMRHCVASYKHACVEGRTAIFSMTSDTALKADQRNLTIEVQRRTGIIIQAKGFTNRYPTPNEQNILNKWADKYNLKQQRRWY